MQLTDIMTTLKAFTPDTASGWKYTATVLMNASQTSLTNWASGGQNSLSLNGLISTTANYRGQQVNWDNSLEVGYGVMNQGSGNGFIKTDDKLDIASKYGYKVFKKWYYSALITLRTQLKEGFYYPNDSIPISRFMAPAYFVGAVGMDFKPGNAFSAFISPVTSKITLVFDKALSDSGSFGVERGHQSRSETGGFVRILFQKELVENISFDLKADFFSNYLKKPENIDINWEMRLTLKAYKVISASISTHLIYDDDVIIETDSDNDGIIDHRGPRLQFKELFSMGITFKF